MLEIKLGTGIVTVKDVSELQAFIDSGEAHAGTQFRKIGSKKWAKLRKSKELKFPKRSPDASLNGLAPEHEQPVAEPVTKELRTGFETLSTASRTCVGCGQPTISDSLCGKCQRESSNRQLKSQLLGREGLASRTPNVSSLLPTPRANSSSDNTNTVQVQAGCLSLLFAGTMVYLPIVMWLRYGASRCAELRDAKEPILNIIVALVFHILVPIACIGFATIFGMTLRLANAITRIFGPMFEETDPPQPQIQTGQRRADPRYDGSGYQQIIIGKSQDAKLFCPHCQTVGHVVRGTIEEAAGISGAKIATALLVSPLTLFVTGISSTRNVVACHCQHCGSTWKQ